MGIATSIPLPVELVTYIFTLLNQRVDELNCSQVCKEWNTIITDITSRIWSKAVGPEFIGSARASLYERPIKIQQESLKRLIKEQPKSAKELVTRIQSFVDRLKEQENGLFLCILASEKKLEPFIIEFYERLPFYQRYPSAFDQVEQCFFLKKMLPQLPSDPLSDGNLFPSHKPWPWQSKERKAPDGWKAWASLYNGSQPTSAHSKANSRFYSIVKSSSDVVMTYFKFPHDPTDDPTLDTKGQFYTGYTEVERQIIDIIKPRAYQKVNTKKVSFFGSLSRSWPSYSP